MGGVKTARQVVKQALKHGKSVVTANKALLAAHGEELFQVAQKFGANLYYEASVGGGIPIIRMIGWITAANGTYSPNGTRCALW